MSHGKGKAPDARVARSKATGHVNPLHPGNLPGCRWFAYCPNRATHMLHGVPTCDTCAVLAGNNAA